jgi:hypothetical protein
MALLTSISERRGVREPVRDLGQPRPK